VQHDVRNAAEGGGKRKLAKYRVQAEMELVDGMIYGLGFRV
jgi:hypothetical protein